VNTISYKTVSANSQTVTKNWVLVDAEGQTLGRLASNIAYLLRGKNKPNFTPHVDCGDNVVVINAAKVVLSGQKATEKQYVRHTEYPGGQRFTTPEQLFMKRPTKVLENAIKGMLPKNRLGRDMFRNLFVYEGAEHKQEAQKPTLIEIKDVK
jgi:large subunit ribosomal protein L13